MELGTLGWKLVTVILLVSVFAGCWLFCEVWRKLFPPDQVVVKAKGNRVMCPYCWDTGDFELLNVHDDENGREHVYVEWPSGCPCYHLAMADVTLDDDGDVIFVVEKEFGE